MLSPDAFPVLYMPQKCVCGRGSAPDPAGGAYSAPPQGPDPLARFEGPLRGAKGKGGREGDEGRKGGRSQGGVERERWGRKGKVG